eukprot:1160765-Pelagomonas_calceolata.AAC.9
MLFKKSKQEQQGDPAHHLGWCSRHYLQLLLDLAVKPLINLGLTNEKAKSLASKLSCHAIQRLATFINTRHALDSHKTLGGVGGAGRWARGGRERKEESLSALEHG